MKIISSIITLLLILVCVAFAVSNRQEVSVNLWPFEYEAFSPLYVLTLGAFLSGFMMGAFLLWLSSLKNFWQKRKLSGEVNKLKDQLEDEKKKNLTITSTP